jgi:hypothetical protein
MSRLSRPILSNPFGTEFNLEIMNLHMSVRLHGMSGLEI